MHQRLDLVVVVAQIVEVSAREVAATGVPSGVDLRVQLGVLERFAARFQEGALVEDCFDSLFEQGHWLVVLLDVRLDRFPFLSLTDFAEPLVHGRLERQDCSDPRDPHLEIGFLVRLDAVEQVQGGIFQQVRRSLQLGLRTEAEFSRLGAAALEELHEPAPLCVVCMDAFEDPCDVAAEMGWYAVVQGRNRLLPFVEQLLELRSLDALPGVDCERACQELTHFPSDGPFANLGVLWVDIETSLELVLLFAVFLPLLELVRLRMFTLEHVDDCDCKGEEVVTHFVIPVGLRLVESGRFVERSFFRTSC